MADNYNPGFGFYESFFKAIEYLPVEQQKEVCYAIVKYGITGEMVSQNEMPLGYSLTIANKWSIDDSVKRWKVNVNRATHEVDTQVSREYEVAQLIQQGFNSVEIGQKLGMDPSNIRKMAPWKERKNPDFIENWLGEKREQNVNLREENVNDGAQNVNDSEIETCKKREQNVKNSREFTREERENSQNGTPFYSF